MPRCLILSPLVLVLGLSACSRGVPTEAFVTTIDRTCTIIERETLVRPDGKEAPGGGREVRRYEGECHEIDDWDSVKAKRAMNLKGKADIHLSFTGPDGKSRNGTIKVTGQDSEFYDLKAGDAVTVLVDADNPERLRFS